MLSKIKLKLLELGFTEKDMIDIKNTYCMSSYKGKIFYQKIYEVYLCFLKIGENEKNALRSHERWQPKADGGAAVIV